MGGTRPGLPSAGFTLEDSLRSALNEATGAPRRARFSPCVLTVFPHREPRDVVREVCASLAPAAKVLDAASPTDAVMTLLSTDVDLVLVDVDGAGVLLAALVRHVQRSAPDATLLGFGVGGSERSVSGEPRESEEGFQGKRPWNELPNTLLRWLQLWQQERLA